MNFEQEIKARSPFRNEVAKAILNVMYTGNAFQSRIQDLLKQFDINDQHYNILRILKGRHPGSACPSEIKDVLINKRGDLTRLLDKLNKMELVLRENNPENRRQIDVFITQKGLDLLRTIDPLIKPISINVEVISKKEAQQLNTILDKLRG